MDNNNNIRDVVRLSKAEYREEAKLALIKFDIYKHILDPIKTNLNTQGKEYIQFVKLCEKAGIYSDIRDDLERMEAARDRFRDYCKQKFFANKFIQEIYEEPFLFYEENLIVMKIRFFKEYEADISKKNADATSRLNAKNLLKAEIISILNGVEKFFENSFSDAQMRDASEADRKIERALDSYATVKNMCRRLGLLKNADFDVMRMENARDQYISFYRRMIELYDFDAKYDQPFESFIAMVDYLHNEITTYENRLNNDVDGVNISEKPLNIKILTMYKDLENMFLDSKKEFKFFHFKKNLMP